MATSRKGFFSQSQSLTLFLIVLMVMRGSAPLRGQSPVLAVSGRISLNSKGKSPEYPLNQFDVKYTSRTTDGGSTSLATVKTTGTGEYTMTVYPGVLSIHVLHSIDELIGGKRFTTWFSGALEGYQVGSDGIALSPNQTVALPTIIVERRPPVPVSYLKDLVPFQSLPTLYLTSFTIPAADSTAGSPQRAPDLSVTKSDHVRISVVDPSGRQIIGAHVNAISVTPETDTESAVIGDEGGFDLTAPTDGVIFIHIEAPSFQSRMLLLTRRRGSAELYDEQSVPIRHSARIELQSLAAETNSEPKSRAFSLDSSRGISFDAQAIKSLPLPLFRNPDVLLGLAPGFADPPQTFSAAGPSLAPGIGTAGSFAINGVRARDNNFTVDGSDYNDEEFGVRRQGFITPFPQPIDSIDYYQAVTANGDARYGRSLGGDINVLSRAGGPRFHASIYAFGTGGALLARDYFQTNISRYPDDFRQLIPITTDGSLAGQPVQFMLDGGYQGFITVRNNMGFQANPLQDGLKTSRISYGGAGGGPLGVRKAYWFGSFERELQDGKIEQSFSVPTVAQRGIADNSGAIGGSSAGNPGGGCTAYFYYPYNYCDVKNSTFYPATVSGDAVLSLFPFPNNPLGPYGDNTYTAVLPNSADGYVGSGRIDKGATLFGRASTFTVRVNYTKDSTDLPSVGNAIFSSLEATIQTTNVASYLTTELSSRFFNTLRFSYGSSSAGFNPLASPLLPSEAIQNTAESSFLLNAPLLVNLTKPSAGFAMYANPTAAGIASTGVLSELTDASESITGPIGQVNIVGYSPAGIDTYHFPQSRKDYTVQFADTVSITSGSSISYIGLDTRSINLDSYEDRNARPYAEFHGSPAFPSNVGLAAAGLPTGVFQTLALKPESFVTFGQREVEIFGQEYFHATPNLTLSGGVRMEIGVLPNANARVQSAFNPTVFSQQVYDAGLQCMSYSLFGFLYQRSECGAVVQAVKSAFNGNLEQVFGSGFQGVTPRVGLAWNALGDGKVVVRAGWGMFKSAFPSAVIDETRSAFDEFLPVNSAVPGDFYKLPSATSPAFSAFCNCGYGYGTALQSGTLNLLPADTNPVELLAVSLLSLRPVLVTKLRQPYSMQFNGTVEVGVGSSGVLDMAYVGSLGRHLVVASTPEGGLGMKLPDFSLLGADSSGFPMYGVLTKYAAPYYETFSAPPVLSEQFQSTASSSYNALQVSFQHRLSNGVQGSLSFTYSHTLDYSSDFFDTAGEYALPGNSQSPTEWGNSAYDVRFRTSGWFSWQVPSVLHDKLTADWHLSGIVTQQSGQPFTVNSSVDLNQDGNATDRPFSVSGIERTGRRRKQLRITRPIAEWAYPADGLSAESAVGRNTFRSSGYSKFDAGVYRDLDLPKVGRLTMRCDVFNLFNHPAFGIPVRILEAPAFGSSVSSIVPARSIQFGLKVSF